MKTLTKIATIALILGTTQLFAVSNDYAITEDYKLLNDMKLAKKQQELIVDMSQALESERVDSITLKIAKEKFSQVLLGLANGNDAINLRGTNIPEIRSKLSKIQRLWDRELSTLNSLPTDSDNRDKAIEALNNIMIEMSQAVALYNKSYNRFRQKSKLSSLVNHHMSDRQNRRLALNIVL